jgi:hypothetical protein
MTRHHRYGVLVLVLALAFPAVILITGGPHGLRGFPLDDAWIHMVYGRSVAASGYLAYNEGIPSTGSTSPLWAYILGIVHLFSPNPSVATILAKAAGILFHGLLVWTSYRILKKMRLPDSVSVIGGLALGFSPALVAASMSGMEVSMGAALSLMGLERYINGKYFSSGILMGFAGLTRPEYGLVIALLVGARGLKALEDKGQVRNLFRFIAPAALAGGLFMGWNIFVDGRPFPATFYVKSGFSQGFLLLDRARVAFRMITADAPLAGGIVWLGILGVALLDKADRRVAILSLLSAVAYAMGQIAVIAPADAQAFYHLRYLLPVVPLFWIPLAAGIWAEIRFFERHKASRGLTLGKILAGGYAGIFLLALTFFLILGNAGWRAKFQNDCRNIDEVQVELGQAIDTTFPADARIGTVDAGAIKYFGRRYTVDLVGLNTPDIFERIPVLADALVLMPAWIQLPPNPPLEEVGRRRTKDYWVTSDARMDNQIIMVCKGDVPASTVTIRVLRREVKIDLRCLTNAQIRGIKEKLRKE